MVLATSHFILARRAPALVSALADAIVVDRVVVLLVPQVIYRRGPELDNEERARQVAVVIVPLAAAAVHGDAVLGLAGEAAFVGLVLRPVGVGIRWGGALPDLVKDDALCKLLWAEPGVRPLLVKVNRPKPPVIASGVGWVLPERKGDI